MIVAEPASMSVGVCGAALTRDEASVTILGVSDKPGSSYEIFKRLADRKITVDMIIQNIGEGDKADISFTVPSDELKETLRAVKEAAKIVGASDVSHDDAVAKVSVVGVGMANQTGVAEKMFQAIAKAGINIQMISTSEIKISILVARSEGQAALRAVHQAFQLDTKPADANVWDVHAHRERTTRSISEIIESLRTVNMEQLTLVDISMTVDQARITLSGVPDAPGLASNIFNTVAAAGIFVDMIVQSCDGVPGETSISFTVPAQQLDDCMAVLNKMKVQFRKISGSNEIAKLSVSGIGLRSHTSVGIGMFEALATAGINVQMINTSELRVNVVVDGKDGQRGLEALQRKFADSLM